MKSALLWGWVALVCLLPPPRGAGAAEPTTIGVLGDSYSDEYQFYAPDRSSGRNWVEILAATRGLDFGRFSRESRGEPRLQGYEFNWARSDATTDDLIATGQHTGLASQVAAGAVDYAVIFIGGNDFIHALESPDPAGAVTRALPGALHNYRVALETILEASPRVKVVAVTVPDVRSLPMFQAAPRDGRLTGAVFDQCSGALAQYNGQIRALARTRPRVALADFDLTVRVADRISRRYAHIAGHRLERAGGRNDPDHLFLADRRHLGTIGQGLMAQLVVNAMDARFGAGVAPLSDRDINVFARSFAAGEDDRGGATGLVGRAAIASGLRASPE